MRRTSIAAAALAVLALGATTAADAAVKKGTFAGKTSEKDPLGFQVTKKHKVTNFYFEGVTLYCDDGSTIDSPSGDSRFNIDLKFKISKSRRFTISVNDGNGADIEAKGRFNKKGSKAKGPFRMTAKFDSQSGDESQNGDVKCKSHKLKWTAKRQ
jgi:opacity protein-like surface antigen